MPHRIAMLCLALIVFVMSVGNSEAVQCYECTSKNGNNKDCEDSFNSNGANIRKCTGKYCLKEISSSPQSYRGYHLRLTAPEVSSEQLVGAGRRVLKNATREINPNELMSAAVDYYTTRVCAPTSFSPLLYNECSGDCSFQGYSEKVCVCNGDLCNSAQSTGPNVASLLAASAALALVTTLCC